MTEHDDDVTFLDMGGYLPPLSRSAFQLHGFAVINSIKDGTPGFVSDDYLNAISAETTTPALELEVAGVWERREDGYFIVKDEMLKIALDWGEENDARQAECLERGEHVAADGDQDSGWIICANCGIPMQRPGGGPVALPNGGGLGPHRDLGDHDDA